jgi:hypothetical protein
VQGDRPITIEKRRAHEALHREQRHQTRECMHRGEKLTQICRRKEEDHELDVEEASDKPRRVVVTERESLRNGIDSLVISWLGTGVARVLRVNASEPMVGWKGAHPQSVSWLQFEIDKYSHTLYN